MPTFTPKVHNASTYSNHGCRCGTCRADHNKYNTAYQNAYKKSRRDKVAAMKVAEGCVDCGYDAHPDALHYDHVRGEKLFDVARGVTSKGWKKVLEEMTKCEVVCSNCHAVRTAERRK